MTRWRHVCAISHTWRARHLTAAMRRSSTVKCCRPMKAAISNSCGRDPSWLIEACRGFVQHAAPRCDHLRIETRAVLGCALLIFEIDVNNPEALRVTMRPLEIVEQRPGEVPVQIDAGLTRRVNRCDVLTHVVDAQRIGDAIVR